MMGLRRAAFDGTYYRAAYHALAGALHCAGDASDVERVSQVERLATEQMECSQAALGKFSETVPANCARICSICALSVWAAF